jgi:hypothetical protein
MRARGSSTDREFFMSSLPSARFAAIGRAGGRHSTFGSAILAGAIALAITAAGGTPAAARIIGADPADPAAKTASVGYRSTIAPYTSMRPSQPGLWRERNEKVTPPSKPERDSR